MVKVASSVRVHLPFCYLTTWHMIPSICKTDISTTIIVKKSRTFVSKTLTSSVVLQRGGRYENRNSIGNEAAKVESDCMQNEEVGTVYI